MEPSSLSRSAVTAASKHGRHRLLYALLLGGLFTAHAGFANAIGVEPLTTTSLAKALALLTEPDLMETAFREGLASYEDGDYTAATDTWLAPAKYGHAGAQFSLGVAYATGNGVAQSLDTAIRWWNAAARQGHAAAQLNLGLLYSRGLGVEKDLVKARDWWQRAADGGNAIAQFQLGAMAATGDGIPLDFDEAIRWWRLSAAQGYERAIEGLQILRRHGYVADQTP
jgi:TPR repeat protein